MAKRKDYEGGAWQVGGVRSNRPKVSPAVRRGLLLRYIEHAQTRIDQGVTIYEGILQEYRRELGAEPLAKPGEIGRGRGKDRVGNTKSSEDGNTASYKLARLQRDRPDLAEKVAV